MSDSLYALRELLEPDLTHEEQQECASQPFLAVLDGRGLIILEIVLFVYIFVGLSVLMEDFYIPHLMRLVKDFSMPVCFAGSCIVAAGNCCVDMTINLTSMAGGTGSNNTGYGEIMGGCTFDMLALYGAALLCSKESIAFSSWQMSLFYGVWCIVSLVLMFRLFSLEPQNLQIAALCMLILYALFAASLYFISKWYSNSDTLKEHDTESPASDEQEAILPDSTEHARPSPTLPKWLLQLILRYQSMKQACFRSWEIMFSKILVAEANLSTQERPGTILTSSVVIAKCIGILLVFVSIEVALTGRFACYVQVRKEALGGTMLAFASGYPDLLFVAILCRLGQMDMALSVVFGTFMFNSMVSLGLPWFLCSFWMDVFPPPPHSLMSTYLTMISCGLVLLVILVKYMLQRFLRDPPKIYAGTMLVSLYIVYVLFVDYDGARRRAAHPDL